MSPRIKDLEDEIVAEDHKQRAWALGMDIDRLKYQISQYQQSLKDNVDYIKFIESFSIMVHVNGKDVPVTRDNISFFNDNQDLIKTEINMMKIKLCHLQNKYDKVKNNG